MYLMYVLLYCVLQYLFYYFVFSKSNQNIKYNYIADKSIK